MILDDISPECGGYATRSVELGLDATRPDPEGYEVDQNDCVKPSSTTPSSAEMCRARFRDGVEEDDLLDANGLPIRRKTKGAGQRTKEAIRPCLGDD